MVEPPRPDMRHAQTSAPYILFLEVACQTHTRGVTSKDTQCELLKESQVVYEDKDMQIVFPATVAVSDHESIAEEMEDAFNQTTPPHN